MDADAGASMELRGMHAEKSPNNESSGIDDNEEQKQISIGRRPARGVPICQALFTRTRRHTDKAAL